MDIYSVYSPIGNIYYEMYDLFWGASFNPTENAVVQFLFITLVFAFYVFTVVFSFKLVLRFLKYLWRLL